MSNDQIGPEPERDQAESVQKAEKAESGRNEAERFRRLAEEAREVRDHHREALEAVRQEQERLREASEAARNAGERKRERPPMPRVTRLWTLFTPAPKRMQTTLENMKVVEEMRRTLREIRDLNKLDVH